MYATKFLYNVNYNELIKLYAQTLLFNYLKTTVYLFCLVTVMYIPNDHL